MLQPSFGRLGMHYGNKALSLRGCNDSLWTGVLGFRLSTCSSPSFFNPFRPSLLFLVHYLSIPTLSPDFTPPVSSFTHTVPPPPLFHTSGTTSTNLQSSPNQILLRVQAKFPQSLFPQPGKNCAQTALYMYRAILIAGSPGIEKTNECVCARNWRSTCRWG
jgi:hypothetical protein